MPNELSEKVYPDGTVVKLRDDTAREQIEDIIPQVTKLLGLIDFVHDLPPDASTTPANIPTGIRVHFNISSQRAGYPMGNVLYVSIKIENTRCVQILFECNTGNPIMLRTSLTASTWSNWTTISQS